jgi:hypothetical protein
MTEFVDWCERNAYRPENLTVVKQEMLRLFGSKYDRLRRGNPPQRVRLWLGVRWQTDPDANPFQDDPTLSGTEAALAEWNRRSH